MSRPSKADQIDFVSTRCREIAAKFGFREISEIPDVLADVDAAWFFGRREQTLETCVLCFGLNWRPQRSLLVECFGSQMQTEDLRANGVVGNAIAYNLNQYQRYHLKIPSAEILPVPIQMCMPMSSWDGTFKRIEKELQVVLGSVWEKIALRLVR